MLKNLAIIQARMSSTRLPGKVLLPLSDKPVLEHVIQRVRNCKLVDKVVVATTVHDSDDIIEDWCKKNNFEYFHHFCFQYNFNIYEHPSTTRMTIIKFNL